MKATIDADPEDMLIFAAVVQAGSFSQAAIGLGKTKQVVSERVARLERALGVRLLERTTRRLRATDAGAAYAARCARIAAEIVDANEQARAAQAEPRGVLRVASPTLYGRRFLTPVIARYREAYSQVQVVVTLTNRPVDLIADGFDAAIQIGRLKDSDFAARRLGDSALCFVASPAYLASYGTPSVAELPRARCLGFRESESWHIDAQRVRITPIVAMNDVEALCDLALSGAGIAQLPGFVCDAAVREGRLIRLFPDTRAPHRQISVVYPSRQILAARVARFLEVLSGTSMPGVTPPRE